MNYRKFYQDELGLILDKSYDVHHIDSNRKNNKLSNLVSIPKKLHCKYHTRKANYEDIISRINDCNYFYKLEYLSFINVIHSFMDVKNEISEYIIKRDNCYNEKYGRIY